MNAEIIAVGTELLLGQILNTNARYLSQRLSEFGINLFYQTVVGDNRERLISALEIASGRADIIIATGGLGPTEDDLTKETIAEFCGLKCVTHEESLKALKERFQKNGMYMPENNLKQVEMPEGCIVLKNDNGTAPGAIVESEKGIFIMLPGPPKEMEPLFEKEVCPYLKAKTNGVIYSKSLRVFGIGESALAEKLHSLMTESKNPSIAPYAKTGEVVLRLTASADDENKAKEMVDSLEKTVRDVLGDMVYAEGDDNSLEATVCSLLIDKKMKIATAESCTGGLLAKKITSVSGASSCFDCGLVTYSNEQKKKLLGVRKKTLKRYGAVSVQTAFEMCKGVRNRANADFGIGITGIAGPTGGTDEKPVGLVYIGICGENVHKVLRFKFAGNRDDVRQRAAMNALDLVRKTILGIEI